MFVSYSSGAEGAFPTRPDFSMPTGYLNLRAPDTLKRRDKTTRKRALTRSTTLVIRDTILLVSLHLE
jgi:hypothetical protein